jgi:hypothetical protein
MFCLLLDGRRRREGKIKRERGEREREIEREMARPALLAVSCVVAIMCN